MLGVREAALGSWGFGQLLGQDAALRTPLLLASCSTSSASLISLSHCHVLCLLLFVSVSEVFYPAQLRQDGLRGVAGGAEGDAPSWASS